MSCSKTTSFTTVLALLAAMAALMPGCKGDIDPARQESLRDDLETVITGIRGAPPAEDPGRGGWDTEVFSSRAQETLEAFVHLLDSPPAEAPPRGLLGKEFRCSALRPARLEETFRKGRFIVRKAAGGKPDSLRKGREGLEFSIRGLLAAFPGARDQHTKLKLF